MKQATLYDTANFLNELAKIDPFAIENLVETRVECNNALADHPTVQVHYNEEWKNYLVGFLGLLNGLLSDELNPNLRLFVNAEHGNYTFGVKDWSEVEASAKENEAK